MRGCRSARARILRESDQRLAADEAFLLSEHLERCAACRRFRAVELEIRGALAQVGEPSLDGAALERAVGDIRGALGRGGALGSRHRTLAPPLLAAGALAAAVLLALLGLRWIRAHTRPAPVSVGPVAGRADAAPEAARTQPAGAQPAATTPRQEKGAGTGPGTAADPVATPRTPEELRARLRLELAAGPSDPSPPPAAAGTGAGSGLPEAVAEARRRLAAVSAGWGAGWPLERFVEELVGDPDPALARSAALALGAIGDRLSVPALRAALARPAVAPAAVQALGELGPAAAGALELALREPALESAVLAALRRIGPSPAVSVLERSLAERSPSLPSARLSTLVELGAPAVGALLRLAERRPPERALYLAELERLAAVADALVPELRSGAASPALLEEAALRLPSGGALAWVAERCLERGARDGALATLARWEGVAALETALELRRGGRLSSERVQALLVELLERDPRRARVLAEEVVGDDVRTRELLETLLACGVPGTGAACAVLVDSALSEDERLWAALGAGELGSPLEAAALSASLARTRPEERRLRAALVLSIHRLEGQEGVERALPGALHDDAWLRLARVLSEAHGRDASVSIHRVARALDDVAQRSRDPWRST